MVTDSQICKPVAGSCQKSAPGLEIFQILYIDSIIFENSELEDLTDDHNVVPMP